MTPTEDSSRCILTSFMEVPKSYFEKIIDEMKEAKGVHYDTELDANDLKELAEKFKLYTKRL